MPARNFGKQKLASKSVVSASFHWRAPRCWKTNSAALRALASGLHPATPLSHEVPGQGTVSSLLLIPGEELCCYTFRQLAMVEGDHRAARRGALIQIGFEIEE